MPAHGDDPGAAPAWTAMAAAGNWFRGAPASLQQTLARLGVVRRCGNGQTLFVRGDAPDGLYCVISGAVCVAGVREDGRQALLALVEPPQWFGEISLLDGLPRTHDAWAHGPSTVVHVPQRPLLAALDAEPALWRAVGQLAAGKMRAAFLSIEHDTLLPPSRRVAARLLQMAEGFGELDRQSRRIARLSQAQLAVMLGLSRQTVNQALRELAASGIVKTARGSIDIVDVARLRGLLAD